MRPATELGVFGVSFWFPLKVIDLRPSPDLHFSFNARFLAAYSSCDDECAGRKLVSKRHIQTTLCVLAVNIIMSPARRVEIKFDEVKATQVASLLVSKFGGKMSHLALMKFLYIVDREAIARWGRPVMGGAYYSLPHGPIISPVLTLMQKIEGWDDPSFWSEHLSKMGNEMNLLKPAGDDELSDAELALVDEVFQTYRNLNKWQLRDLTHNFGEWTDPHGSNIPIAIEEILFHVGKKGSEISKVLGQLQALEEINSLIEV